MHFLASWWERSPAREVMPSLVAVMAIVVVSNAHIGSLVGHLLNQSGFSWG